MKLSAGHWQFSELVTKPERTSSVNEASDHKQSINPIKAKVGLLISVESTHLVPKRGLYHSHSGPTSWRDAALAPERRNGGGGKAAQTLQLRSGGCASAALSWFRGECCFRVPWVVLSGRIGAKVGGLAAGRILTVSPPCAQCDRYPHPPTPPALQCLPLLFPCP